MRWRRKQFACFQIIFNWHKTYRLFLQSFFLSFSLRELWYRFNKTFIYIYRAITIIKAKTRNMFTNLHNQLDYCTFWLKRWGIIFAWIQLGKKQFTGCCCFFFLQNCDSIEYYVLQEITLLIIWLIPQASKINPTLWSDSATLAGKMSLSFSLGLWLRRYFGHILYIKSL